MDGDRMKVSGGLAGRVMAQPSKSMAHRALICAALAGGESRIENVSRSADMEATMRCIRALGMADMAFEGNAVCIRPGQREPGGRALLDCGESGSTLRFFMPIAPLFCAAAEFTGAGRLMERPQEPMRSLLSQKGASWNGMTVSGQYAPGTFALAGDVSSQFISGLLFALPLLDGDSEIVLTTPLESAAYVDMTLAALGAFGVKAGFAGERVLRVPGGQKYQPRQFTVEGDYSHAAFFAVAGATGRGPVSIAGLAADSLQGDRAIFSILEEMGAKVEWSGGEVTVYPSALHGVDMDVRQTPDLVPALAVAACAAQGETRISGAARLRIKESDRLAAMRLELSALGADICETEDGLRISGGKPLRGGRVNAHGDHRIAMAMAIAAVQAQGAAIEIGGASSVAKSAPQFWEEFRVLGGCAL